LLCARYCSNCLLCINPCNHHNNPMRKVILTSSFYKWGIWGTEKWSNCTEINSYELQQLNSNLSHLIPILIFWTTILFCTWPNSGQWDLRKKKKKLLGIFLESILTLEYWTHTERRKLLGTTEKQSQQSDTPLWSLSHLFMSCYVR